MVGTAAGSIPVVWKMQGKSSDYPRFYIVLDPSLSAFTFIVLPNLIFLRTPGGK